MSDVFYEDDFFKLAYEIERGEMFLHCDVKKWSPSSYKKLRWAFNELLIIAAEVGLDSVYTYTPNSKFAKLFKPIIEIGTFFHDGKTYNVFEWEIYPSLELGG